MTEGRDMLHRPEEDGSAVSGLYRSGGQVVLLDESGPGANSIEVSATNASNSVTPRTVRPRISPEPLVTGRGSSTRRGLRRHSRNPGLLPSWYPRRALGDITTIVRVIERRRSRLGEEELEADIRTPIQNRRRESQLSPSSSALRHELSIASPSSNIPKEPISPSLGKVPSILSSVAKSAKGKDAALFNSMETWGKVVLNELDKLKRTPIAKKMEREGNVRTLKSMR